jgi:hypothetical protein
MRRFRGVLPVLLLALLLAAPAMAWAAAPAQTGPVPAPPGLVSPETKPAMPGQAGNQGQAPQPSVTNVTNNNVTLPPMPSVQEFAGGIFTQVLTTLLGALADALQALIGQAVGGGGTAGQHLRQPRRRGPVGQGAARRRRQPGPDRRLLRRPHRPG